MTTDIPVRERIYQLMQHLGIHQAHFAGRALSTLDGFEAQRSGMVSSLTLLCPGVPDAGQLDHLAAKLLVITGDGRSFKPVRQAFDRVPEVQQVILSDYTAWSDVAAVHTEQISAAMFPFLAGTGSAPASPAAADQEYGEAAGITYHIQGSGPPLLLFPIGLIPSQWEPLVPRLRQHYQVITLGGAHLGIVALLELRSQQAGYLSMFRNVITEAQLQAGESVLEVGCGTGSLIRWLHRYTRGQNPIAGLDINDYLLREAAGLARAEGLDGKITFRKGDAEALPYSDNQFDLTLSVTVMEEVDADRMLAEMIRVTRPGGRVAVIVRALDRPMFVHIPLDDDALRTKVENSRDWRPGVAQRGCADASLYRRFQQSALSRVISFPQQSVFYIPDILKWPEHILAPEEVASWRAAGEAALADGSYFCAWPHHCAVGTKVA